MTGPLVGLLWGTAAAASHIGSRHVPPWQWVGALPGSLMVLPLAAAIAIAVWTALFTIAATGRATRWLPDRPRLLLAGRAARRCLTTRAALTAPLGNGEDEVWRAAPAAARRTRTAGHG